MNHSLGQPPPRCPYRLSALALVVMVSACRPPPPTPPPEPAPPLPGPILRMEPVAGDTAEAVFAMDPVTLGTTLVYRARSPSPTQSLVVPGSSPQRRAVRLDRGSLSGPLTVDLRRGFSIALRVRIDGQGDLLGSAGASNGMIVAVGNGYSDGFRIQADTPRRRLTFSIGRPAAPYSVSVVSPPVEFGRWLDIVATWDGHVMRLYVDGWLVAERAMTASYTVPARNILTIGYANAGVGSLNMAFERAELFTQALSPSACLRLLVPDVVPTAEFVELWDSLAVAARRSKATEEELAQLDALRSAADALPITFRLAARRLEAELASQHRNTARAADAYLDLCDHASAPSGWSDGAREELRRFLREGATAGWSPALLDRLAGVVKLEPADQLKLDFARLAAQIEAGNAQAAARAAQAVLAAPQASAADRSTARLALARLALERGDVAAMREHLRAVRASDGAPLSHRDEAERLLADPEPGRARDRLPPPPQFPKPGVELFVAPDGQDQNPGTRDRPLATPTGARDALRRLRASAPLPAGGATIWFAPGRYSLRAPLLLDGRDSGSAESPVVWRALDPAHPPHFDGGIRVRPAPLSPPMRELADPAAAEHLVEFDLAAFGLTNLPPLILGGFASGRGFRTRPTIELFADGEALPRSRWPDDGWVTLAAVYGTNPVLQRGHSTGAMKEGIIGYDGDRPARWTREPALLLYGYWHHRWADSYEHVAAIAPAQRQITLLPPWHTYGFKTGGFWCAVNAVSEISRPGEWAIVPAAQRIVAWPPASATADTEWVVSTCLEPMLRAENLAHCAFLHITWQYGAHDALQFRSATNLFIAGCTIRHFAGDAIRLDGGLSNTVRSCDIYSMGRGGVYAAGGDRRRLTAGGHQILNNHFHHLSRIHPTYTPAALLAGVGHRVAHCLAHDIASSAIRISGNEHLIEMNEICHVVKESDDQGGAELYGNPTYRGVRFLHNFWHHIGRQPGETITAEVGRAAIRLDDAISGVVIHGNVFLHCGAGTKNMFGSVQIHGGKDNEVDANIIALAPAALSFSPWSESRWREHIAGVLEKPDIDRDLYLRRYPALASLADDPNRNWILRNYIWRCDMLGWRAPGANHWIANLVSSLDASPFAAPSHGDFRLSPAQRAPGSLGPDPIPFEFMGLRPDPFRPVVPEQLIRQLRNPASDHPAGI